MLHLGAAGWIARSDRGLGKDGRNPEGQTQITIPFTKLTVYALLDPPALELERPDSFIYYLPLYSRVTWDLGIRRYYN